MTRGQPPLQQICVMWHGKHMQIIGWACMHVVYTYIIAKTISGFCCIIDNRVEDWAFHSFLTETANKMAGTLHTRAHKHPEKKAKNVNTIANTIAQVPALPAYLWGWYTTGWGWLCTTVTLLVVCWAANCCWGYCTRINNNYFIAFWRTVRTIGNEDGVGTSMASN